MRYRLQPAACPATADLNKKVKRFKSKPVNYLKQSPSEVHSHFRVQLPQSIKQSQACNVFSGLIRQRFSFQLGGAAQLDSSAAAGKETRYFLRAKISPVFVSAHSFGSFSRSDLKQTWKLPLGSGSCWRWGKDWLIPSPNSPLCPRRASDLSRQCCCSFPSFLNFLLTVLRLRKVKEPLQEGTRMNLPPALSNRFLSKSLGEHICTGTRTILASKYRRRISGAVPSRAKLKVKIMLRRFFSIENCFPQPLPENTSRTSPWFSLTSPHPGARTAESQLCTRSGFGEQQRHRLAHPHFLPGYLAYVTSPGQAQSETRCGTAGARGRTRHGVL